MIEINRRKKTIDKFGNFTNAKRKSELNFTNVNFKYYKLYETSNGCSSVTITNHPTDATVIGIRNQHVVVHLRNLRSNWRSAVGMLEVTTYSERSSHIDEDDDDTLLLLSTSGTEY